MNKFSIGDIENLTGIKTQTIRKWEQRYHLMHSKRSPTNVRFYDDDDLCYFLNVAALVNNGYKISAVAGMPAEEMAAMVAGLASGQDQHIVVYNLINATVRLDEFEINRILSDIIAATDLTTAANRVIFPFMVKVGLMWQTGTFNPAHEHFATNIVRHKIITAISALPDALNEKPKRFLLFLPPGETHDTGLLMAHYLLKKQGQHVLYLGQDVPYYVLHETADYYRPDFAITALTLSKNGTPGQVAAQLLTDLPHWPLIISGPLIVNADIESHERLTVVKDFEDFEEVITKAIKHY